MIFRNYTVAISRSDAKQCADAALGDVLANSDRLQGRIGTAREYPWGTVELIIYPKEYMRWLDLSYAVRSIYEWLTLYDPVDLNFDVLIQRRGLVGTGRLANVI